MEQEQYIVDGFVFYDKQEATIAESESKKIQQIEEKLKYDNLEAVAMIYLKGIQNQLFRTVVGCSYLKKLQFHLQQNQYDKIDFDKNPIQGPVGIRAMDESESVVKVEKALKVRINHQKELKQKLKWANMINVVLLALVGALFAIAMMGENANILNYRYNIQNQYSQWEQELQEREDAIREKEDALHISE